VGKVSRSLTPRSSDLCERLTKVQVEDQQETMEDLTEEPMVDLDVDPDTGEFSILTGEELLRVRYS